MARVAEPAAFITHSRARDHRTLFDGEGTGTSSDLEEAKAGIWLLVAADIQLATSHP